MAESYCPECKMATQVVFDHSAGDRICSECALVLEAHSVDETAEWRTFSDDSGKNDATRVGGQNNPLLDDGGLCIMVARPDRSSSLDNNLAYSLSRSNVCSGNPNARLLEAFNEIKIMSDRLGLVSTVTDRANEIFKKVGDQSKLRGRKLNAILGGCLFMACRHEGKPRTVAEIMFVANGAKKKDIGRAKAYICKLLEVGTGAVQAADYLRRFCCYVGLNSRTTKAAQEFEQKSKEFDIRRSPSAVAGAIIYIMSQLSEDKKSFREISTCIPVAEGTIRNAYRDIYPHVSELVPNWYAKQEELENLFQPASKG